MCNASKAQEIKIHNIEKIFQINEKKATHRKKTKDMNNQFIRKKFKCPLTYEKVLIFIIRHR